MLHWLPVTYTVRGHRFISRAAIFKWWLATGIKIYLTIHRKHMKQNILETKLGANLKVNIIMTKFGQQ